ncbi:PIR protein [Plasmodium sp. DRC-Itaito]|nr:PIR protein [Plasmodium sp. DRC-Itaito]
MKLYCSKILLFFILLNILAHNNKNEPYITTHHTPITTSRLLSECDTQSSNYDKDTGMKSVMQQFVDRTSQRFEEYKERLKDKRQKRIEEREKNIQEIIEKDKREKSLEQKIEKGCLKCGCALGGGVLPVWGLVCGAGYAGWSQYLSAKALPAGVRKGIQVGLGEIVKIVKKTRYIKDAPEITVEEMLSSGNFTNGVNLYDMVKHISTMYDRLHGVYYQFCSVVDDIVKEGTITEFNTQNSAHITAVTEAFEDGKAAAIAAEHAKYTHLYSAIGYSFLAILIIVLVMIIIYLVLRYRRKKKMKKKAECTKLLNQ